MKLILDISQIICNIVVIVVSILGFIKVNDYISKKEYEERELKRIKIDDECYRMQTGNIPEK